jgi:hypothetical protein
VPSLSPTLTSSPTLPPDHVCAGNLFENSDFEGGTIAPWAAYAGSTTVAQLHNDVVIPGNTAVQISRPDWGHGVWLRINRDCFMETGSKFKLEMDVRLLDGVTGEGLDCDPTIPNNLLCPLASFQIMLAQGNYPQWFFYDEGMEWNKDGWTHFSVVFDMPDEWARAAWIQTVIRGGPDDSILVLDNISLEKHNGRSTGSPPGDVGNNQIQLSPEAAACWAPGSEILITSGTKSYNGHQLATIESTDPFSGTIKLTTEIEPVSTLVSQPDYAVEVALLNRRIIFEADDDPNDDLIGGHLIVFHTPNVEQQLEGVEIRNFGQQGNLGRYPIHFHLCNNAHGSVVKKNVV